MLENPKDQIKDIKIPKKFEGAYIISDNIERINHILTFKNFEEITYQTSLTKAFSNQPLQTPLIFYFNGNTSLNYSKEFTFTIVNYELPFDIQINLLFKTNTIDNSTLFTISLFLKNIRLQKNSNLNKIVKGCKNLCVEYINLLEILLKKTNQFLFQYESIIVNCSNEKIWESIINFEIIKNFYKLSIPNFNPKEIEEGKIIEINLENSRKKMLIKFGKIIHEKDNKKSELHIIPLDNELSNQEIIFITIKLNEEQTFISITHKFNENILFEQIKCIENKKKYLLKLFKQLIKKKSQNNNKINDENFENDKIDENERDCKSEFDINNNKSTDLSTFYELTKNLNV